MNIAQQKWLQTHSFERTSQHLPGACFNVPIEDTFVQVRPPLAFEPTVHLIPPPPQLPRPNVPVPSHVTADFHAPTQQVVNYLHNVASLFLSFFFSLSLNTEPEHTLVGAPQAKQPQRLPYFFLLLCQALWLET